MPIYEYECPRHGKFEMLRPMSDVDKLGKCPHMMGDFKCRRHPKRLFSSGVRARIPGAAGSGKEEERG